MINEKRDRHSPFKGRICSVGVWDESIPDITFDENGKSSYCVLQEQLMDDYPRGEKGKNEWETIVRKMRAEGVGKKYDCIVGISGGTDSSYLLHVCSNYELRVLAVNLDNGWNSDIAVNNIKRMTRHLGYDLITNVIDYPEVQAAMRAYLKASLPWVDSPSDMAIKTTLYKVALKERIRFILNGSDFRTEGKQPFLWTYGDAKQFNFLLKNNERIKPKSFQVISNRRLAFLSICKGFKVIRPFYFLDYSKQRAQEILKSMYGWEYYGGHHHENVFTKFIMSYWLYEKFGIDKRKITLSAQIMNGDITREEAVSEIDKCPYDDNESDNLIRYVCEKLNTSKNEFWKWFHLPNKYYYDYPNSFNLLFKNMRLVSFISSKMFLFKPTSIKLREISKKRDHS